MLFSYATEDEESAEGVVSVTASSLNRNARLLRITMLTPGCDLQLLDLQLSLEPCFGPTMFSTYHRALTLHAARPCLGVRSRASNPSTAALGAPQRAEVPAAGFEWMTYAELHRLVTYAGEGLLALARAQGLTLRGSVAALCGANSAQWVACMLALCWQSAAIAPLAPTTPEEQLVPLLARTKVAIVLCDPNLVATFARLASTASATDVPPPRIIAGLDPPDGRQEAPRDPPTSHGTAITCFSQLVAGGRLARGSNPFAPLAQPEEGRTVDDEAQPFIFYFTSGSTGLPKTVRRSFAEANRLISSYGVPQCAVHLSFMPLSHISEGAMLPTTLVQGGAVGFASAPPHSILDDATLLRPTFINSVPRLFETLEGIHHDHVRRKLAAGETVEAATAAADAEARATLGGRVQSLCAGSAPVAASLKAWMKRTFPECFVADGYGCTAPVLPPCSLCACRLRVP